MKTLSGMTFGLAGLLAMMPLPLGCGGSSGTTSTGGSSGGQHTGGSSGGLGSGGSSGGLGSGGTNGSGSGGTNGSGGSLGSGGSTGSGGGAVSAGGGTGSGGTTAAGGRTGSGGAVSTGGGTGAGGSSGGTTLTGMFGSQPILPIMTGLWIGVPKNPAETGGGPFVYLFSGSSVKCADISKGNGWIPMIPAGVQVLEMLLGTTTPGVVLPATQSGAPGFVEANYAYGSIVGEHRAASGTVTLTKYVKDQYVEGTIDLVFPVGSAKGSFHADWCPTGQEF